MTRYQCAYCVYDQTQDRPTTTLTDPETGDIIIVCPQCGNQLSVTDA